MRDHRLLRGFCICIVLLTNSFAAHGQSTMSLRRGAVGTRPAGDAVRTRLFVQGRFVEGVIAQTS